MKNDFLKYLKNFKIDFNLFLKKNNKDIITAAKIITEAFKKKINF